MQDENRNTGDHYNSRLGIHAFAKEQYCLLENADEIHADQDEVIYYT